MKTRSPAVSRIKNIAEAVLPRDFSFGPLSFLVLAAGVAAGIAVQLSLVETPTELLLATAVGALAAGGLLYWLPVWIAVVQLVIVGGGALLFMPGVDTTALAVGGAAGLVLAPCFQLVQHWDKAVVLRMGRFRRVHGPGLFLLLPVIERVTQFVDTRIRATDFSAEKTLTRDTVPVHVDALTFWMIWDAKRAVLEVENYTEAVVLSAQTALRDAIGKSDLGALLSDRERLGRQIQQSLDAKTNPWGITILSIEFTDVIIPRELENAMSRRAQAERESQSRVILGAAEVEVAQKYREAAAEYGDSQTALHLRAMNMVYDGLKSPGSSIMVLPSSALESMSLGTVMGAAAMQKAAGAGPDAGPDPAVSARPAQAEATGGEAGAELATDHGERPAPPNSSPNKHRLQRGG